jgi:GNAT superfamily N-acetyltransferase
VNAVERLAVKLARIQVFVPRHPRFRMGQIEDVEAYHYMREGPDPDKGTASQVPLDQRSPTPASEGKIVQVVEVKDTREWDDNVEPPKPIPGSGDARQCDRCGRMHEVHVIVRLDDGREAVIGSGCARKDEMDVVRKAVASAKTVDRLEHQLAKAQSRLQAANEAWAKVQAMEPPEIENRGRGAIGTEWGMGDAHMYQHDQGPITEERKSSLIDAWRVNRLKELGAEESYKPATLVEDLEKRLKRAYKAREKANSVELARTYVGPYLRVGEHGQIERVDPYWRTYESREFLPSPRSPGASMPARGRPEPPAPPSVAPSDAPFIAVPADAAEVGTDTRNTPLKVPGGSYVRGTVMSPEDPRIPPVVYHVTTNLPAVMAAGRLKAGGVGGLGGDPDDRMVSMTIDREIAEQLVDDIRFNAKIEGLQRGRPRATWDEEKKVWTDEPIASSYAITEALTAKAKEEGWEFGPDEFAEHQRRTYNAHDYLNWYFTQRASKTGKRNPVFFFEYGAGVDPDKVGIVSIPKADLRTGALLTNFDVGENYGLSEIRLYGDVPVRPPEAVIPPLPGEVPIPEGHVRLFHVTPLRNIESIRERGLTKQEARGESYGEPNQVWASAGIHSEQAKRVIEGGLMDSDFAVVEFHANPAKLDIGSGRRPESLEARASDVTLYGDVPPGDIVAVHEPWHSAYRYLDTYRYEVAGGEYDYAAEDNENYARAIDKIKQEEAAKITPAVEDRLGNIHFESGGDAVPGGYNGYFVAYDEATGKKMGYIDFQSAKGYPVTIAMIEVEPEFQRQGVATALVRRLQQDFPDQELEWGMTTPEGEALRKAIMPEAEGTPIEETFNLEIPPEPEPEWRMEHRPNPDGAHGYDLTQDMPDDVYEHPEYYTSMNSGDPEFDAAGRESIMALREVRNQPDARIIIYRSSPEGTGITPGDWVTPSPTYAEISGRHPTDASRDLPVHALRVRARDIRWSGDDLNEFGYFPEEPDVPAEINPTGKLTPKMQDTLLRIQEAGGEPIIDVDLRTALALKRRGHPIERTVLDRERNIRGWRWTGEQVSTSPRIKPSWRPAVELAKQYDTFDEFRRDWVTKNYHGIYWHVTDDPNFKIDPHYVPREMSSMGTGEGGPSEGPGALEVTTDPQNWGAVFKGKRKYIARIELGDAKPGVDFQDTTRGFGGEIWVNNLDKVKVTKVYPWEKGLAAHRRLYEGGGLPQGEEDLQAIWDQAHPEGEAPPAAPEAEFTPVPSKTVSELEPGDEVWHRSDTGPMVPATVQRVRSDPNASGGLRDGWLKVDTDQGDYWAAPNHPAGLVRQHSPWVESSDIPTWYWDTATIRPSGGSSSEAIAWREGISEEDQLLLTFWEEKFAHVQAIRANPDDSASRRLDEVLRSAPVADDPVYRGFRSEVAWGERIGRTFRISTPTSGSTRPSQAASFGNTLLRITGAPARLVGNAMDEAVLLPGRYEVVGIHEEMIGSEMNVIGIPGTTRPEPYQVVDVRWIEEVPHSKKGAAAPRLERVR